MYASILYVCCVCVSVLRRSIAKKKKKSEKEKEKAKAKKGEKNAVTKTLLCSLRHPLPTGTFNTEPKKKTRRKGIHLFLSVLFFRFFFFLETSFFSCSCSSGVALLFFLADFSGEY